MEFVRKKIFPKLKDQKTKDLLKENGPHVDARNFVIFLVVEY